MANNQVLPDEIIDEILLRSPVETLFRFKSVSHGWNTRISSPSFIKSHREYNPMKVMLCAREPEPTIHSFSINREEKVRKNVPLKNCLKIAGSCNGLLLLVSHEPFSLCIWNPFTGQYEQLPIPGNFTWNTYGFGCTKGETSYSDNYKVLLIRKLEEQSPGLSKVYLYSSHSGEWSTKKNVNYRFSVDSSALVNGKLHFLARDVRIRRVLVAFDIEKEEFGEVPEPDYEVPHLTSCNVMSELNGKLCIISFNEMERGKKYLWLMKEYGVKESWTNMFSINVNKISYLGVGCFYVRPLHFGIDGKILLHAYFRVSEMNSFVPYMLLVYYDPQNHEERILKLADTSDRYSTTVYRESLASLNVFS